MDLLLRFDRSVASRFSPRWLGYLACLGIPSWLILAAFLYWNHDAVHLTLDETIFAFLAVGWFWLGAFSIIEYEGTLEATHDRFCADVLGGARMATPTGRGFLLLRVAWTAGVVAAFVTGSGFMEFKFGLGHPVNALWVMAILAVTTLAYLTAVGITGVVRTLQLVRQWSDHPGLVIRPYHPDLTGGLSLVGDLTTRTTLFFSTGTLFVPALLAVARYEGAAATVVIFLLVGTFSFLTLLIFVVPNVWMYQAASRSLYQQLALVDREIQSVIAQLGTGPATPEQAATLYVLRARWSDLKNMNVFPFSQSVLVKIAASVLIPVGMLLLEHFAWS